MGFYRKGVEDHEGGCSHPLGDPTESEPPHMRAPKKDTTKWCGFDKDVGDDIRDCPHLKKEIKKLILKAYLGDIGEIPIKEPRLDLIDTYLEKMPP